MGHFLSASPTKKFFGQISVTHHASVVHESAPLTVRNLFPQIWQPHIGSVAFD
jgi:hypothetical protein